MTEDNRTDPEIAGAANPPPATPNPALAANAKLVRDSGFFDAAWYVRRHPEVVETGLDPALHLLTIGTEKLLPPSPGFDAADYAARYKDVARTGMNPLLHYIRFGRKEGRMVKPADPEEALARLVARSGYFDEAWYLAQYPEVAGADMPPVRYFLKHGRNEGHNPGPRFDSAAYLEAYGSAVGPQHNPLLHFLQTGRALNCEAIPVARAAADTPEREAENIRLLESSELFDAGWYSASHPAAAETGLTPELHFLRIGGKKGWASSPLFDTADYLARYRDVRELGINPLVHYLQFGKAENRKIRPWNEGEANVRLVTESGFFDEDWYLKAYPEVRRSKLTPVRHYVKHGREKGHNPGPAFDSNYYAEQNQDVAASAVNPLVHYLRTGRDEGRPIQPVPVVAEAEPPPREEPQSEEPVDAAPQADEPAPEPAAPQPAENLLPEPTAEDLGLIEASPLFDATWYVQRYPDVARQPLPPAEHYLKMGGAELRQPSLLFDPQYYVVEQSPEIQHTGLNPLLHYLKTGRALGRRPRALFEFPLSAPGARPLTPGAWPLAVLADPPDIDPHWTRHADIAAAKPEGALHLGGMLVAWPGAEGLLEAALHRLAAFAALSRIDDAPTLPDATRLTCFGESLNSGPAFLADGWFTNTHGLRLRFGADTEEAGVGPRVIHAFQCAAGGSRAVTLVGEALLAGKGPAFADLSLASPLMPILVVVSDVQGRASDAGLIAFPSLFRGGLHHAELAGAGQVSQPARDLRKLNDLYAAGLLPGHRPTGHLVAAIRAGLSGASGAEPLFSAELRDWLAIVCGVGMSAEGPASPGEAWLDGLLAGGLAPRNGQYTLSLPPESLPTLAALTAGPCSGPDHCLGSYFVTDATGARPRLSVQLPEGVEDLPGIQPEWNAGAPSLSRTGSGQISGTGPLPHVAIRLAPTIEQSRAPQLMPLAPDSVMPVLPVAADGPVDVVIRVSNPARLAMALRGLLLQEGPAIAAIRADVAAGDCPEAEVADVLAAEAPGRGTVRMVRRHAAIGVSTLIEASPSAYTLVMDDAALLHDRRTLAALLGLVKSGRTASASCVLIRESAARRGTALTFESGGYMPSHVSLFAAPRLILSLPDTRAALPQMTYPVIANEPTLLLLGNHAVRDAEDGGLNQQGAPGDSIAFSLRALARGYRHLCTSAVRAAVLGTPQVREAIDPPGTDELTPERWSAILPAITVIRTLY